MQSLTIQNAISYLQSMYYTNIQFVRQLDSNLYFTVTDEDNLTKEIEFEPEGNKVIVSVHTSPDDPFVIIDILKD